MRSYTETDAEESGDFVPRPTKPRRLIRWCGRLRIATVAIGVLIMLYGLGIFAPLVAPYDPLAQDLTGVNELPSAEHILGTDRLGRDLFSRVLFALRNDIGITIATFFAGGGFIAVFLGILSGYKGGWVDTIVARSGEALSMLPGLLLMILISATVRPQYETFMSGILDWPPVKWASGEGIPFLIGIAIISVAAILAAKRKGSARVGIIAILAALSVSSALIMAWLVSIEGFADFLRIFIVLLPFSWYGTARIIRSQTISLMNKDFIAAAKALGVSDLRIITHHIFPNVLNLVIVGMSAGLGGIIASEIALTYLGLGIQPPTPSFGAMLYDAGSIRSLVATPHLMLVPSVVIMLFIFSWNLVGDALAYDLSVKSSS